MGQGSTRALNGQAANLGGRRLGRAEEGAATGTPRMQELAPGDPAALRRHPATTGLTDVTPMRGGTAGRTDGGAHGPSPGGPTRERGKKAERNGQADTHGPRVTQEKVTAPRRGELRTLPAGGQHLSPAGAAPLPRLLRQTNSVPYRIWAPLTWGMRKGRGLSSRPCRSTTSGGLWCGWTGGGVDPSLQWTHGPGPYQSPRRGQSLRAAVLARPRLHRLESARPAKRRGGARPGHQAPQGRLGPLSSGRAPARPPAAVTSNCVALCRPPHISGTVCLNTSLGYVPPEPCLSLCEPCQPEAPRFARCPPA